MGNAKGTIARRDSRITGEERRAQILETALDLVAERGVPGTTMARIAAKVGVSEPALYRYFDTRLELLLAAIDLLRDRARGWITSSSEPNALQRLREIGESHASFVSGEGEGFSSPLLDFIAASPHAGLRARLRETHFENIGVLAGIVDEGKAQGSIRQDADSELVAWQVMRLAWAETVSSLMGLDQSVNKEVSAMMLTRILADIAASAQVDAPENEGRTLKESEAGAGPIIAQ